MPSPKPSTAMLLPVRHLVEEGLHLRYALYLVDDLLQGSPAPQVQGDQPAGQLGDAVLEAASLTQSAEDLEGLPVLVHGYRDEEVPHLRLKPCRGAGQAARPLPRRSGHGLPPSARQSGRVREHSMASILP